jgi:hypothetical protein
LVNFRFDEPFGESFNVDFVAKSIVFWRCTIEHTFTFLTFDLPRLEPAVRSAGERRSCDGGVTLDRG